MSRKLLLCSALFLVACGGGGSDAADAVNTVNQALNELSNEIQSATENTVTDNSSTNTQSSSTAGLSVSLPRTGQTSCFSDAGSVSCAGTGQDGEQLKGVSWPSPRFLVNTDGSITDALTELMWPQDANLMVTRDVGFDTDNTADDGLVTWQNALNYVAKLNTENYLGYADWRLPNRNELRSLANYDSTTSNYLSDAGFTNLGVGGTIYWSSTTVTTIPGNALTVTPTSGRAVFSSKTASYRRVLPVRGGSDNATAAVPRTGQTVCYDESGTTITCTGTGQDGDSLAGVQWPSTRISENGQTATDNLTGLMWVTDNNLMFSQNPSFDTDFSADGAVNWQTALNYIAQLNSEQYLGFNNWRLPNVNELYSLINSSLIDETQLFAAYYWSSTASGTSGAWVVILRGAEEGGVYVTGTGTNFISYVWPVRDAN